MAKSDCGLPANSKATPSAISRAEEDLRWLLYQKKITFKEYEKRYKKLKREGKIYRRF